MLWNALFFALLIYYDKIRNIYIFYFRKQLTVSLFIYIYFHLITDYVFLLDLIHKLERNLKNSKAHRNNYFLIKKKVKINKNIFFYVILIRMTRIKLSSNLLKICNCFANFMFWQLKQNEYEIKISYSNAVYNYDDRSVKCLKFLLNYKFWVLVFFFIYIFIPRSWC